MLHILFYMSIEVKAFMKVPVVVNIYTHGYSWGFSVASRNCLPIASAQILKVQQARHVTGNPFPF